MKKEKSAISIKKQNNSQQSPSGFLLKYSTLILIVVGFLLYAQSIKFGYTNLDDKTLLLDDKDFISHFSSIPQAFQKDVFKSAGATFYRPMLVVSFILDGTIGKMSMVVFHFTNILLHILSALLLFKFFVKLKLNERFSLLLCIQFLVHPVLTQAVAWVPGRNDSLLAVFTLSSFLFLFHYFEEYKKRFFILHCLFFLFALLTKETAIVLPILYLMIGSYVGKHKLFSKKQIVLGCVWIVSIVAWYLLRSNAIKYSVASAPTQFVENIPSNIPALLLYIGKILLPFNLSTMPTMPDSTWVYGLFTLVFFCCAFLFLKSKMSVQIIFGISWFLLFLLPVLLIPKESAFYYEHRLYLPIIGIFIVFGEMQTKLIEAKSKHEKISNYIVVTLIIIFSSTTFLYSKNFANKFTFWEKAIATSPNSGYVNKILASIYYIEKRNDEAEKYYLRALELSPKETGIRNDLGVIYSERNEHEKAIKLLEEEIILNPKSDKAAYNLARSYYQLKKYPDAEKYWLKSVEINPEYPEAYQCLAIVYADMKNFDKARQHAHRAETLGITVPEGFWNMVGK